MFFSSLSLYVAYVAYVVQVVHVCVACVAYIACVAYVLSGFSLSIYVAYVVSRSAKMKFFFLCRSVPLRCLNTPVVTSNRTTFDSLGRPPLI